AELAAARAARDAARSAVESKWLKIYDTVSQKRGYGIAPVVKGVCQGCHMALPPQLNNILARMESIETCPRCGRLVYRKELLEPALQPRDVDRLGQEVVLDAGRIAERRDHDDVRARQPRRDLPGREEGE